MRTYIKRSKQNRLIEGHIVTDGLYSLIINDTLWKKYTRPDIIEMLLKGRDVVRKSDIVRKVLF